MNHRDGEEDFQAWTARQSDEVLSTIVIPAKAGTQDLDPCFRRDDEERGDGRRAVVALP
jgi:hypothetical protein